MLVFQTLKISSMILVQWWSEKGTNITVACATCYDGGNSQE